MSTEQSFKKKILSNVFLVVKTVLDVFFLTKIRPVLKNFPAKKRIGFVYQNRSSVETHFVGSAFKYQILRLFQKLKPNFCFSFPSVIGRFLKCSLHIGCRKNPQKWACLCRLSEQFSESQAAFGTIFKVMGGLLKAERMSLKGVSGRIFKIASFFIKPSQY